MPKRINNKTIVGERAILSDGTKVICSWEDSILEGERMLSCYKHSGSIGSIVTLIGTLPSNDWKWRCPPESLQSHNRKDK